MAVADKLFLTGLTVTAFCTALNECCNDTWLYGPDSYTFHMIHPQQLEQAIRWWTTAFRDFPSPDKHIDSPLGTTFYPGPCGKCPVCALDGPATPGECVCVAAAGYTPEFESALVSNITSQHATAAALIVEYEHRAAAPAAAPPAAAAPAAETVAATCAQPHDCVLTAVSAPASDTQPAAGQIDVQACHSELSSGPVATSDIVDVALAVDCIQLVSGMTVGVSGTECSQQAAAEGHTQPMQHPPPAALSFAAEQGTSALMAAPQLSHANPQLSPADIQQEEQQQLSQPEQQQQHGHAASLGQASQHQHSPPQPLQQQQQQLPRSISAGPGPLTSSHLPHTARSNGRALLGLQAHTGSPPRTLSSAGTSTSRWELGIQLQPPIHTTPVTSQPQIFGTTPSTSAAGTSDPVQAPAAGISGGVRVSRSRLKIRCKFGSYSFLWPLVRRFFYLTADGAQKLTHYANAGKSHTAAWKDLNIPVPYGRYFAPRVDYMYKMCVQSRDERDAAAASTAAASLPSGSSGPPASTATVDDDNPCQAELLAARSEPPRGKTANTDVKVVAGCVCPHVVSL